MRTLLIALLLPLLFCSCSSPRSGESVRSAKQDLTQEARQWADSVVTTMPLRRQIAQLLIPGIYTDTMPATLAQATRYAHEGMGGVVLLKGNCHSARRLADTLQSLSQTPMFVSVDAEWGLAMRFSDAPAMPRNCEMGGRTDQELYDYGYRLAAQARELGINMILGPVLDVAAGGVVDSRTYGSDPKRVADLGVAFARGLEDGNVLSVAKHFPGHGPAAVDSHKGLPVITRPLVMLDSIDLLPFRRYIAEGLSCVMVGHLAVSAIDPEMRSAALSPVVITDLLRGDLGFDGLVITDALNMAGAGKGECMELDALLAGADMIIAPRNTQDAVDRIERGVKEGKISRTAIAERCRRILMKKYLLCA